MEAKDVKVDLEELKEFKRRNAEERLWFIDYWVKYMKSHSDEEWSAQQKTLIDSQIQNVRELAKRNRQK